MGHQYFLECEDWEDNNECAENIVTRRINIRKQLVLCGLTSVTDKDKS